MKCDMHAIFWQETSSEEAAWETVVNGRMLLNLILKKQSMKG
jgi:hypothetical protein